MKYEHVNHAIFANEAQGLAATGDRVSYVSGISQLVAGLSLDAQAALDSVAKLVDLVEAGAEEEALLVAAHTLGRDAATIVAAGYRVAALLQYPHFDEAVDRALDSALISMLSTVRGARP